MKIASIMEVSTNTVSSRFRGALPWALQVDEPVGNADQHSSIDLPIRSDHGPCVVERRMLSALKEIAVAPTLQVFDLFRAGAALEQRVAELRSTQNGHQLSWETRTVTSDRNAGSTREDPRSIIP